MSIGRFTVEVDVVLCRPFWVDRTLYYVILAHDGVEAELIACQWAQSHTNVVMAVGSVVTSWPEEEGKLTCTSKTTTKSSGPLRNLGHSTTP